jgi:hypothetical protein
MKLEYRIGNTSENEVHEMRDTSPLKLYMRIPRN